MVSIIGGRGLAGSNNLALIFRLALRSFELISSRMRPLGIKADHRPLGKPSLSPTVNTGELRTTGQRRPAGGRRCQETIGTGRDRRCARSISAFVVDLPVG